MSLPSEYTAGVIADYSKKRAKALLVIAAFVEAEPEKTAHGK